MVKPKAPLFGLGASGKLGDALVYGNWKGLDVAREYVVPANPKTAAQSTQRGYMTEAVAEWHTIGALALEGADQEAWNRYAGVLGRMSGFNAFCQSWVTERAMGGTPWGHFYNMDVTDPLHNSMDITIAGDGLGTTTTWLNLGVTKTFFPKRVSVAASASVATFTNVDSGFAAGETVYFWFSTGSPGISYVRSGLYTKKLT